MPRLLRLTEQKYALRRLPQLDAVAEHDQPVDAPHRLQQRLAQLGPADEVDVLRRAEVQIGDHERAHGGPP